MMQNLKGSNYGWQDISTKLEYNVKDIKNYHFVVLSRLSPFFVDSVKMNEADKQNIPRPLTYHFS